MDFFAGKKSGLYYSLLNKANVSGFFQVLGYSLGQKVVVVKFYYAESLPQDALDILQDHTKQM